MPVMNKEKTVVADRLAQAVTAAGGVPAVATALGITTATVYAWKRGHKPFPDTMRRLAQLAGVSVEWLSGTSDAPDPTTLREDAPVYGAGGSLQVPADLRSEFSRFALRYRMNEPDAFRLLFDFFMNRTTVK